MKIVILTSSPRGTASHHLKVLGQQPGVEIIGVILAGRGGDRQFRHWKRKLKKIFQIGLLGALNGWRMRRWYTRHIDHYLDISWLRDVCDDYDIPFHESPKINCEETRSIFQRLSPDLGISLGNGYIGSKVFRIPRYGMVNIHHELLPDYQNAQSILWNLYNGSNISGYTIHMIDRRIDTGDIVYQEKMTIKLKNSLRQTVSYNYAQLWEISATGLTDVLLHWREYYRNRRQQEKGRSYTTPTIWQYLKIVRNFHRMKKSDIVE